MATSSVKLGAIDLNLLVVFDAVMQERSVTRAGRRLGLSQPAMSHALARLRHMLRDDLFIRSPEGMIPTPRAEQLDLPIRMALEGLTDSLQPKDFHPHTAARDFRIAVDNYTAVVLVGPLVKRIAKAAPLVTLDIRPRGTLNILGQLDRGELDLAIGPFAERAERFSQQKLLRDEYVAVMRKNHPLASAQALSSEEFATWPYLEISSFHYSTDFIDDALAQRKLTRRIALRAPFISAAQILGTSDMISAFPRRIAKEFIRHRPLVARPLPHTSAIYEVAMIWSRRLVNQPAHRWLREIVGLVTKGLRSE